MYSYFTPQNESKQALCLILPTALKMKDTISD